MSTFRTQQGKTILRMDILPPDVSAKAARPIRRGGEVVDAQFFTVPVHGAGNRRRSHNDNHREAFEATTISRPWLEQILAAGERALMRLSADSFSAVVAMIFVAVFTLAGGFSSFLGGDRTSVAAPVLDITHVTMTPQDANGMRVLLINGIIENRSSGSLSMPAIRADLLSGEDVLATTLISPPAAAIAAGHSRGFSARVPQPGGKLPDLRLSFAEQGA